MNTNRRGLAVLALVMSLAIVGCGLGQSFVPTLTPAPTLPPTLTPLPASTPTLTPDPKILTLKATGDLLKLLDTWNGKYVILVNKNTDIKTLEDLNGKNIFCDMYLFGMEASVKDMAAFKTAAGVQMQIEIGNNMPQFLKLMTEDKNLVAFIPKKEADGNSLQDNPDFKIVLFK
jgi:hypothetical protein